jgi:hypothetical protein
VHRLRFRLPRGRERGAEHRGGARRDCAGRRRGYPAGEPRTSAAAPIGVVAGIPRLAREDVKPSAGICSPRQGYLEEHVGANIPAACRTYAAEFGAGARGRLGQRRRAAMQEHLGHCPACQDLFTELTALNSRLGAILTPAALAAASSALGSAKRAAILRAGLTAHWRTWRWHPVTSVTGAAAGPPVPAAAPWSPFARKRQPGGGSPGGGAASVAAHSGPHSLAGPGSPASPGSPAGTGSLAAVTPPSGTIAGARPGGSVPGTPAVGSPPASQAPSSGGSTARSTQANPTQTIANTPGATVTGLTNTASNAVTGLVNTASATVALFSGNR